MSFGRNFLTGAILLASGTYKTFSDYKKTPEENKNRTLARNLAVLGMATAAVFTADCFIAKKFKAKTLQYYSLRITDKIIKSNLVKSFMRKFMPDKTLKPTRLTALANVAINCARDIVIAVSALTAGIFGGFVVDKILAKCKSTTKKELPEKYKKQYEKVSTSFNKVMTNPMIDRFANDKSKNAIINAVKIFNVAGFFPNPFDATGTVLSSYEMSKEKNLKKVVEKTSVGILANSLIPTMFLSFTNSITKDGKMIFKLPALATSFYIGDIIGRKITQKLIKEVPQKEVSQDFQN